MIYYTHTETAHPSGGALQGDNPCEFVFFTLQPLWR